MTTHPTPEALAEPDQQAFTMRDAEIWLDDSPFADDAKCLVLLRTLSAELAAARSENGTAGYAAKIEYLIAERDSLRARLDRAFGAAQEHFGEDCIRYKLSLFKNGRAMNVFPAEMDGKWYALQRADNDAHIGLCDTIASLRAEVERLQTLVGHLAVPVGHELVPVREIGLMRAELAGQSAAIGHLSTLVDEQRAMLAAAEPCLAIDTWGVPLEDGDSKLLDSIRAHLAAIAPPVAEGV